MRLRSLLYVPAHRADFLARAHERGADAVILDLEDGVPEEAKDAARAGLPAAVAAVGQGGAPVLVRVDAAPGRLAADVDAALAAGAWGIVRPKARAPADLDGLPEGRVLALAEDPGALLDARSLAAHPAVLGLALGSEDFCLALGAQPDPEVLRAPKLLLHYAAKAAGRLSFGLFRSAADLDPSGLRDAAREARRHGFDGATCVHPSAVAPLNEGFTPDAAEIEAARAVLAAGGAGAVRLGGRMVDAPVVARARATLARAGLDGGEA